MAYNRYRRDKVDWIALMDDYSICLLEELGYNIRGLFGHKGALKNVIHSTGENPLMREIIEDPLRLVDIGTRLNPRRKREGTVSILGVCRAYVLCQMILFDYVAGPDSNGSNTPQRRHWYKYFKKFGQLLAAVTGKTTRNSQGADEMNDKDWSGRLSDIYGELVMTGKVTYEDLWIKDASRMHKEYGLDNALIPGLAIIVTVEKDSLFEDFIGAAKALGAVALSSGKGKMSFAATELLLRNLGWSEERNDHNAERELRDWTTVYLTVSDLDYDGHGVIMPTFSRQARRYLPEERVIQARIGINVDQVEQSLDGGTWEASYEVKLKDNSYRQWAERNALYWATCNACGHQRYIYGLINATECNVCTGADWAVENADEPHGFEVEALRTSDYYAEMVRALLSVVDFNSIVTSLRRNTRPSGYNAAYYAVQGRLQDHDAYQRIQRAKGYLENLASDLEDQMRQVAENLAGEVIQREEDNWMAMGDDPAPRDFENFVVANGRSEYGSKWTPFNEWERTQFIQQIIEDDADLAERLEQMTIDVDSALERVDDILRNGAE
jgi:hypothetical protein